MSVCVFFLNPMHLVVLAPFSGVFRLGEGKYLTQDHTAIQGHPNPEPNALPLQLMTGSVHRSYALADHSPHLYPSQPQWPA